MTALYVFIATEESYDVVVPPRCRTWEDLNRAVSGAFSGMVGGRLQVGNLLFRPTAAAIDNHLLCDGSVYNMSEFPRLSEYLGNTFGGDGITTFAVPDYVNEALTTAATAPAQEVDAGGTISNEETVITQPTGAGQTGGSTGGNVSSGGRVQRIRDNEDYV